MIDQESYDRQIENDPQLRVYFNRPLDYGDIADKIDRYEKLMDSIPCGPDDYFCDAGKGCPNHVAMRELKHWCESCETEAEWVSEDRECADCLRCGPQGYFCDSGRPCPNHGEGRELIGWCSFCEREEYTDDEGICFRGWFILQEYVWAADDRPFAFAAFIAWMVFLGAAIWLVARFV